MKKFSILMAALALAACEPPMPTAPDEADATGRQFSAPPTGMAALYVYGRSAKINIAANRLMLGDVMRKYWLRADLPPGRYDLRCVGVGLELASNNLVVDLQPGQTVFVSVGADFWRGACDMVIESPTVAQPAILAGKRVRELN
ncbi:MAG: hypothetical protein U1E23_14690 [Reyranellaceae bacterium]